MPEQKIVRKVRSPVLQLNTAHPALSNYSQNCKKSNKDCERPVDLLVTLILVLNMHPGMLNGIILSRRTKRQKMETYSAIAPVTIISQVRAQ
jgi:hypothetical protein